MKDSDLSGVLKTKKELLQEMLDITKDIGHLIAEDNIDELNARLNDRQEIILLIDALNEQQEALDPDDCRESDLKKEIIEVICDIVLIDRTNEKLAGEKFDSIKTEIRELNLNKKSRAGYSDKDKFDGVFVDAKK